MTQTYSVLLVTVLKLSIKSTTPKKPLNPKLIPPPQSPADSHPDFHISDLTARLSWINWENLGVNPNRRSVLTSLALTSDNMN